MSDSISKAAIRREVESRLGWLFEDVAGGYFYRVTNPEGRSVLGRESQLGAASSIGAKICQDKLASYEVISSLDIPVIPYTHADDPKTNEAFLAKHQRIVVKPRTGQQSQGITVDVTTTTQLAKALDVAKPYCSRGAVLQRHVDGDLYRILVVGDKVIAAAVRRAAVVTGDGKKTIEALIDEENEDPRRIAAEYLKAISLDDAQEILGVDGISRIPSKGEKVQVGMIASVSRGGQAEEMTSSVPLQLSEKLVMIVQALGLRICGFDIISKDITKEEIEIHILEINSMPGFKLHLYPTAGGTPIDPSASVIDNAFAD